MRPIQLLLLCLLFPTFLTAQQLVPCDDRMYHFSSSGTGNSTLERGVMTSPGDQIEYQVQTIAEDIGLRLNAVGYSVQHRLFYGIEETTLRVWQLDGAGEAIDLGRPLNLDTTLIYQAGTVTPNGKTLVLIGHDPVVAEDVLIHTISLSNNPLYAGTTMILSDEPVHVGDVAFHPRFGYLRGFNAYTKNLVDISTFSGLVTEFGFAGVPGVGNLQALHFDRSGRLFGYGGSSGSASRLYLFDPGNGELLAQKTHTTRFTTDAAACPYRIRVEKQIEPQVVLPCSEVTITYIIHNEAGTGYSSTRLSDTLPDGMIIQEVLKTPGYSQLPGVEGMSQFTSPSFDLLLGTDSLVLRVEVGDLPAGTFASQASFGPLPIALGGMLRSDDPATPAALDATAVEVSAGSDIFGETELPLCPGATITLTPRGSGISYLWNTGETTPAIEVDLPGQYWCEILADCGLYRDTITVVGVPQPPTVSISSNRTTQLGVDLNLFASASVPVASYLWTVDSTAELSCYDCADPVLLGPVNNAMIGVEIISEQGCLARDSAEILVEKASRIYIPSGFSPNADGYNDFFFVQTPSNDYRVRRFLVRDRWGNQVFYREQSTPNSGQEGWDGRFRNLEVPSGVYVYLIEVELPDGRIEERVGELVLLR